MRHLAKLVLVLTLSATVGATQEAGVSGPRARDLGIPFNGQPGRHNAITDVPGVLVGHTTVVQGEGGDAVRTGVTAIFPRAELGYYPAATFVLNGDAELFGAIFADEFGMLRSPIMLTGTASPGTVYTSVIKWSLERFPERPVYMPVVADTWDADMSDAFRFPLGEDHVRAALNGASGGPVAEGSVGGGTGMICNRFKGGIGTASRVVQIKDAAYTVGVLVQCNQGARDDLLVAGVPVGQAIQDLQPEFPSEPATDEAADGSILIVVGTDAPLNSTTLKALARRAALGLSRAGGAANPFSGDVVLAFGTQAMDYDEATYRMAGDHLFQYAAEDLYQAAIQATEEAIINSMVAGRTMTGLNGAVVHGLPHDRVVEILRRHGRLNGDFAAGATIP